MKKPTKRKGKNKKKKKKRRNMSMERGKEEKEVFKEKDTYNEPIMYSILCT